MMLVCGEVSTTMSSTAETVTVWGLFQHPSQRDNGLGQDGIEACAFVASGMEYNPQGLHIRCQPHVVDQEVNPFLKVRAVGRTQVDKIDSVNEHRMNVEFTNPLKKRSDAVIGRRLVSPGLRPRSEYLDRFCFRWQTFTFH